MLQVKSGFACEEDVRNISRQMRERVAQVKRDTERKIAEQQQQPQTSSNTALPTSSAPQTSAAQMNGTLGTQADTNCEWHLNTDDLVQDCCISSTRNTSACTKT